MTVTVTGMATSVALRRRESRTPGVASAARALMRMDLLSDIPAADVGDSVTCRSR